MKHDWIDFIHSYGRHINILYVEDDDAIASGVIPFLNKLFPHVERASDGMEGLNRYQSSRHKLVISDLAMPRLNGIEMCREIKSINPEQDIIITSAYSDAEYFTQTIKMGIDGYITKPIDYDQFIEILYKTVLSIKAKEEQQERGLALKHMLKEKTEKLDEIYKRFDKKVNEKTNHIQKINDRLYELSNNLSKYFSPQVFSSLSKDNHQAQINSVRKKVTVFFSDIKEFTATTDALEAEELTYLLNSYLDEMSKIALKYDATIDKFIGDAILIFVGDPISKGVKNDAARCVAMALAMQRKMSDLQRIWQSQGITRPFHIRMGIATGYCTVGNFGSEHKMEYTIIGSIVNLANRLQTEAKPDGILISEETHLLVKNTFRCEKKEVVHVNGFEKPVQTYEVISVNEEDVLEESRDGFYLYIDYEKQKENSHAIQKFLKQALKKLEKS